jgi:hypothetical protein
MRFRPMFYVLAVGLLLGLWSPETALAALTVTRSELNGGQLRVEGQGAVPNAAIAIDGVVRGTADNTGFFRIEVANFSSPTCRVTDSDGTTSVQTTLAGCTPSQGGSGSLSIIPGGNGSGVVTSQPAGINCTITGGNGSGTCTAYFPAGTVVRLDARPAANSQFQGWRGLPGCGDPSKITIFANMNISCQPGFQLKF